MNLLSLLGSGFLLTKSWSATTGSATVVVDPLTFSYSVRVASSEWLSNGGVGLHCGGRRYADHVPEHSSTLPLIGGKITTLVNGTHPNLGTYRSISRTWTAVTGKLNSTHSRLCTTVTTSIRSYKQGGIEFVTTVGAMGAADTASEAVLKISGTRTATEFPTFKYSHSSRQFRSRLRAKPLPATAPSTATTGPGILTWTGNSLRGMERNWPAPANFSEWFGGLEAGPLVLYSYGADGSSTAVVIGASSQFKVGIMSRVDDRLVAGVQGMVREVPSNYSLTFALYGSTNGITAAMSGYGAMLQRRHDTSESKLPLSSDPLSRQLHYVTDGGSLLNYCDYWPHCVNSTTRQFPDGPTGCTPMSVTLKKVSSYHKRIGLNVSLYHVDPFWTSTQPFGGCENGAYTQTFSASPFHFRSGLKALGIPMMLFLQGFTPQNAYIRSYEWAGESVSGRDAARFFRDRFADVTSGGSVCNALTLDGVQGVFYSDESRYNNTASQTEFDAGLSDATLAHKIPLRVDQQTPSDILGSVAYGSRTVARCTGDANPCTVGRPCSNHQRWVQLAGAVLLLTSVGLRPFTDNLWTSSVQSGDPRWGIHATRPTPGHDLISAVLTTGPVGFADLINNTDTALLSTATRVDGTILKPISPALRIGRYYREAPYGGAEIWSAVTGPAGGTDSSHDSRANSLIFLSDSSTRKARPLWWRAMFMTNVNGSAPNGAPVKMSELWPRPRSDTVMLVTLVDNSFNESGVMQDTPSKTHCCINGSAASTCMLVWDQQHALPIDSIPTSIDKNGRNPWRPSSNGTSTSDSKFQLNYELLFASPILSSGWTLIGEIGKIVPCSPQRFVAASSAAVPQDKDFISTPGGADLTFNVIGTPGEHILVMTVSPPPAHAGKDPLMGIIIITDVLIAADGKAATVTCLEESSIPRCTVE